MYITFYVVLIILAFCFFGLSFIVKKITVPFISLILFVIIGFFGMGVQDAQCDLGINSSNCMTYIYEDQDLGNITQQNCTNIQGYTCTSVIGVDNYLPWIFSAFAIFSAALIGLRMMDFNNQKRDEEI